MIVFRGEIKKTPTDYNAALRRLRAVLETEEPRLISFIARLWDRQQAALSYKEIREAILAGSLTQGVLDRWQIEYAAFIDQYLMPSWLVAMAAAEQQLVERYPEYLYNPNGAHIRAWTTQRAAQLVVDITEQQRKAINDLVQRATMINDMSVDQLARAIRPVVGLYPQQAMANFRYYNTVLQNLMETHPRITAAQAEGRAQEAALKYAGMQHRYRAQMIARTELVTAYNHGELGAVKQAIHDGMMGRSVKRWVTADDERVCDGCKALEGVEVPIDDLFPGGLDAPTLHPHCRCVLVYIEKD